MSPGRRASAARRQAWRRSGSLPSSGCCCCCSLSSGCCASTSSRLLGSGGRHRCAWCPCSSRLHSYAHSGSSRSPSCWSRTFRSLPCFPRCTRSRCRPSTSRRWSLSSGYPSTGSAWCTSAASATFRTGCKSRRSFPSPSSHSSSRAACSSPLPTSGRAASPPCVAVCSPGCRPRSLSALPSCLRSPPASSRHSPGARPLLAALSSHHPFLSLLRMLVCAARPLDTTTPPASRAPFSSSTTPSSATPATSTPPSPPSPPSSSSSGPSACRSSSSSFSGVTARRRRRHAARPRRRSRRPSPSFTGSTRRRCATVFTRSRGTRRARPSPLPGCSI